jgi:hypothetical protein
VVKELVCSRQDEGSIPSNDIPNLVLNDYNMITCVVIDYNMITCVVIDYNMITCVLNDYKMSTCFYLKCKSTHNYFGHNLTPCHVELFKQGF